MVSIMSAMSRSMSGVGASTARAAVWSAVWADLRMRRIISSDQNAKSAKAAKHTSLRKIIDETTNPIGQQADIEVDEQSKIQLHLPQVMAKLRLVHPVNPLERLHLDDDRVLDQKVQPKAARK